jgi:predicted esterase
MKTLLPGAALCGLALLLTTATRAAQDKPAAPPTAASVYASTVLVAPGEKPVLKPGTVYRFEFPELGPSLAAMATGQELPNLLLADLPADYRPDKKFPIFVYLDGGNGGIYLSTKRMREAVGPDDFIVVRMRTYKAVWDKKGPAGGLLIQQSDFPVISRNYRAMLERLYEAVPNITPEGSTLGGFSNGAHTTGILLAGEDEFILRHFSHFYMMEGGIGQFRGDVLKKPVLKDKHYLVLIGDRGRTEPFKGGMAAGIVEQAKAAGLDVTALAMRGYGHENPIPYFQIMPNWIRKRPIPEVPPKPADPAKPTEPAGAPTTPAAPAAPH